MRAMTRTIQIVEFFSSPIISYITALIGAVLLMQNNSSSNLIGCWFFAEFICDWAITGVSHASTADMVAYRYLYAITAIMFALHVLTKSGRYPASAFPFFITVAICSAADGMFNWIARGHGFYDIAEILYILSITAMEVYIIIKGIHHDRINGSDDFPQCGV